MDRPELSVAGIQCGIGNILGMQMAGFSPMYVIDDREHMRRAPANVEVSFPGCVFGTDMDDFQDGYPTVITTSPSCAQFSRLGIKREDRKRGLHNLSMNEYEFITTLSLIFEYRDPEFIIVEYLGSLYKYFSMKPREIEQRTTLETFTFPSKYRVQYLEMNAKQFGVSQNRQRLFILLSKEKYDFLLQPMSDIDIVKPPSVGEVLKKLDDIRKTEGLLNDIMPNHTPERVERMRELKYGESYYGTANNKRIEPDKLCPTITSHRTRYVHPWEPRVLNVRECATLQGFPLDFRFYGAETSQLDMIGKTVPPPMMYYIGKEIKKSIDKYYEVQEMKNKLAGL